MKKVQLTIAIIVFGVLTSIAQSNKNDLNLSVSALPLLGKSDNFSGVNGFVLKTSLLYNINDRTAVGINFSYAGMDRLFVGNIDSHYHSYTMIPSIRNSFINKEKFRMFAELGFGFGTIQYRPDRESYYNYRYDDLSGGISVLNIGIGADYMFSEKFGIEMLIPYIYTKNITSKQSNTIYSGVGPTIGLLYKLN